MPTGAQASPLMQFIPLAMIFVIFYFLIIRPQKKSQQEHKAMIENLSRNDDVVTSSGIHGTIVNIKDKTVILRIDDNTKIEIEKSCIASLKKQPAAAAK
ncbi:MAG: preprotein translocase subunit YajC [Candidatus Omnitrophica bacterium]|jgi:preprotein translocase subunit YajC|nr:preprotein translocase subunit YajC [Candidatus Omnitrophota bacterium]